MIHELPMRRNRNTISTRRGLWRVPTFGSPDIFLTHVTTARSPVTVIFGPMISMEYDRNCENPRVSSAAGAEGHSLTTAAASTFSYAAWNWRSTSSISTRSGVAAASTDRPGAASAAARRVCNSSLVFLSALSACCAFVARSVAAASCC